MAHGATVYRIKHFHGGSILPDHPPALPLLARHVRPRRMHNPQSVAWMRTLLMHCTAQPPIASDAANAHIRKVPRNWSNVASKGRTSTQYLTVEVVFTGTSRSIIYRRTGQCGYYRGGWLRPGREAEERQIRSLRSGPRRNFHPSSG